METSKYNKTYRAPYKGVYRPINPKKYVGNPNRIIYRSSWEKMMMIKLDKNPDIIKWASEELSIPYTNPIDKRRHRYYPDFIVENSSGTKYMIEVKPSRQMKKPIRKKRKTKRYIRESLTYIKNMSKWRAAKEYCDKNNMKFEFITEKELGISY